MSSSGVGLELLFSSVSNQLKTKNDILVVFVHWKLISDSFKCLGLGELTDKDVATASSSELLPEGWNADENGIYQLTYVKGQDLHVLKAIQVDGQLLINLLRTRDGKLCDLSPVTDKYVGDNLASYPNVFLDKDALNRLVEEHILTPLRKQEHAGGKSDQGKAREQPHNPLLEERDPLRVGPPRYPRSDNRGYEWPDPGNPLAVGGRDLDPFGMRGGGGMLMDPRHQMFPGRAGIPPPIPGNLPPGAVPPGARFDPFGPPNPDRYPPAPQYPRPSGRGFSEPDPDHLPPPGYNDDIFM